MAAPPGPALPDAALAGEQPLQAPLLPPRGLSGPSSRLASRRLPGARFLPAFRQPRQAQLLPDGGLFRPDTCLSQPAQRCPELDLRSASPGPASCLPRARRQVQALPHSGVSTPRSWPPCVPPRVRRDCLPAALTGPAPASRWPLSAQLAPHDGLPGPGLSPLAASPGPAPPQVGLSRPSCSLPASSPGPALPPGCVYGPGSCLTATALDSAPAQLLAASVGPKLPQATLSRPSSGLDGGLSGLSSSPSDSVSGPPDFLQWAPLGPAWASRRPLRAQLVVKPASPGPGPAPRRPLRVQHVLEWAPPGPAPASRRPLEAQPLPPSWRPLRAQLFLVLLAASTGPTPASQAKQTTSLGSAPARLPPAFVGPALSPAEALQARLLPPGGLRRRSPSWRTDPAGPAPASQGPLRAQPSPGLTAASRGQVPACLPAASTGAAPP
nr:putative uncharacterized protein FLJ44672 [Pongo pygmaeus]